MMVGGFNPFEKYARQIGGFPQVRVNILKIYLKPPPSYVGYVLNPTELGLMSLSPIVWK